MLCIGLFGTCGGSRWREEFCIPAYEKRGIKYFNPQVEDWDPSMAEAEARHLAEDAIILFPITGETYGLGSLAETGFSILNAIKFDDRREFVIFIAPELDETDPSGAKLDDLLLPNGEKNPRSLAKESTRGRALVAAHLRNLQLPNLYVVDSLEEMRDVSLDLWESVTKRWDLRKYNPHRKEQAKLT